MKLTRIAAISAATALLCHALLASVVAPTSAAADEADPALTQTVTDQEPVAPAGTPAEISVGHADMGPKMTGDTWELMVRDDSAAQPTWRHLDDVVFRVSDSGQLDIPDDPAYQFLGADRAWVIPQQQIADVVWLGWNTQDPPVATGVNGGVDLVFEGHEGPGHFSVFVQAGNFSGPTVLWDSATETAQPIHVDLNTHTHANWVFTQPGTHLVRVSAQAQLSDGTTVSDTRLLRFAVGNQTPTDQARQATWQRGASTDPGPASGHDQAGQANQADSAQSSSLLPWAGGGLVLVLVAVVIAIAVRSRSEKNRRSQAALQAQAGKDGQASSPENGLDGERDHQ